MSISTLENPATRRSLDAIYREQDEQRAQEHGIYREFLAGAKAGDMKAIAWFGSQVTDYTQEHRPKRRERLGEVLYDCLVYDDFSDEAMAILCGVANGLDRTKEAADLIQRMAVKYAFQNS